MLLSEVIWRKVFKTPRFLNFPLLSSPSAWALFLLETHRHVELHGGSRCCSWAKCWGSLLTHMGGHRVQLSIQVIKSVHSKGFFAFGKRFLRMECSTEMVCTNASFSHFSSIVVSIIHYKKEQIICQKILDLFLKWRFHLLILCFENISCACFFQQIDLSGLGVRDCFLRLPTEPSTALRWVMHLRLDLLHIIHTVINSNSSSVVR